MKVLLVSLAAGGLLCALPGVAHARPGARPAPAILSAKLFKLTLPPGWVVRKKQKTKRGERYLIESPNGSARARISAIEKPAPFAKEIERMMARLVARAPDFDLIEQKQLREGGHRFYVVGTRSDYRRSRWRKGSGKALVGGALVELAPNQLLRVQMSVSYRKLEEAQARFARFLGKLEPASGK